MQKDFSISILIPTYNRPIKLKLLLQSIRENCLKELSAYEIRIYDNCSTLDYKNTLKCFEDLNIIYKKNNTNVGMEKNFLKLQEDIQMNYFCIVSDDDCISKNHIKALKDLIKHNKNAKFACSHTVIKKNGKYLKSPSMKSNFWLKESYFTPCNNVIWNMYFNHFVSTGCIFESSILKDITFNQELDDRLFLTELSSKYPFCVNNHATATLTVDKESASSNGSARRDLDHLGLLYSITKKIEQAKRLHKKNLNKEYFPQNQLYLIYIYEYFKDLFKLFLFSKTNKIGQIPINFSLSFVGISSLVIILSCLKIFLKIFFKVKAKINFKKFLKI